MQNACTGLEIRCISNASKGCNSPKRNTQDESLSWLQSDLSTPGSFIFICDTLRIDPDFLRERLLTECASVA